MRHKAPVKPTPGALMKAAKREQQRQTPRMLSAYVGVIRELRAKNFTWKEVQEWLASKGVNYSKGQIFNVAKAKRK